MGFKFVVLDETFTSAQFGVVRSFIVARIVEISAKKMLKIGMDSKQGNEIAAYLNTMPRSKELIIGSGDCGGCNSLCCGGVRNVGWRYLK